MVTSGKLLHVQENTTCSGLLAFQANQSEWSIQHHSLAEAEGKFTTWEVPNGERRFKVPFSMHHLAKQHMDQGAYSQEA